MNINNKKSLFSLIELLVVLALSIVLMVIAIPAFNSLTKGQSVEIGARTIGSQLKAVRSYAITNREYVALIFPTTEGSISDDYLYKSFRSCIVERDGDTYTFEKWIDMGGDPTLESEPNDAEVFRKKHERTFRKTVLIGNRGQYD